MLISFLVSFIFIKEKNMEGAVDLDYAYNILTLIFDFFLVFIVL